MKYESKLKRTPQLAAAPITRGNIVRASRLGPLLVVISLLLSTSIRAGVLSAGGYYKNFTIVLDPVAYKGINSDSEQPLLGSVSNRLRLLVEYHPRRFITIEFAYDISPRIQHTEFFDMPLFAYSIDPSHYRFADLDERIYPAKGGSIENFGLYQNLDRVMISVRTKHADMIIGRQPIAWGSARVINPTDVIAPFTFDELDREDRFGVDAWRVRVPIGFMAECDGGAVFGKDFDFDNSAFFLRSKFYASKTDIAFLILGFRENLLLGLDLSRSVGGASMWFESAYVLVNTFNGGARNENEDYFRTSVGIDYSFGSMSYAFIEYHYNQAGGSTSDDYLTVLETIPYTEGAVYLLGRHYLAPGMSLQLNPLTTLNLRALLNVRDPSLFLTPSLEYNIAENIYIEGGLFWGIGASPEWVEPSGEIPEVRFRSEFGGADDLYYLSFRFYF